MERQQQNQANAAIRAFTASQSFVGRTKPIIDKVSNEYFDLLKVKQQQLALETRSAQIIQKMFRGKDARNALRLMKAAILRIHKVVRNFIIHRRNLIRARAEEKHARVSLYERSAVLIQKTWRGYKSRKRHQHLTQSVRKEYFDRIKSKELEVKRIIASQLQNINAIRLAAKAAEESDKFEHKIRNMHHLVGTSSLPGIYANRPKSATGLQISDKALRSSKAIKERMHSATAKLKAPSLLSGIVGARPKSVIGLVGKIRPISALPLKKRPKSAFPKSSLSKNYDF